jgi:uncharacterized protein YjbI with pentapeptide repeats
MLLKISAPFAFGTKLTSREPKRLSMTIVVRGVFVLRPNEPLAAIESPIDQGFLTGDVFREGDDERTGDLLYPDDFADFKPTSDVLLRGTAHAGEGRKAHDLTVSFRVGGWSKSLRVFGRRIWTENPFDPISSPMAFASIPLTYVNAYGGPEHAKNPGGKGCGTPEVPNVEDPHELLRSKSDRPCPAGFGPISPNRQQRLGKRGTDYGKTWRRARAPFYAADFDWSYFNAAPPDQQLAGYLRGDEELSFENMHPRARRFTQRLPRLRPVVLVRYVDGATRDVTMNLDTLLADVDGERLYLTWRGLAPVEQDDLADVRTLFVASEPLTEPRPREHWMAQLEEFERDPLERDKRIPPEVKKKIEEAKAMAEKAKAEAQAAASKPPPAADAIVWLDSVLAEHGKILSSEQREAAGKIVEQLKETREKAQTTLAEMRAQGKEVPLAKRDGIEDALVVMLDAQRAAAAKRGLPVDKLDATKAKLQEARDRRRAMETQLRAAAKRSPGAASTMASLDSVDAAAAEPQADGTATQLPEPGRGADLMGRDLSKRDLRGADLEGALLRKANLSGALLTGANLRRADLGEADLTGADLAGADLTSANLTGARATGAALDGARVDMTIFSKTDLSETSLAAAQGRMTLFGGTVLVRARLPGVRLYKAVFIDAELAGADFSGADLSICLLTSCDAPDARFDETTLARAGFLKSRLAGASFVGATGDGCSWQEAQLAGADFSHAVLPRAQFTRACLDRARFYGARLREARFHRASLAGTDFTRADCLSAVFNKATLDETNFAGANLFDAKLLGTAATAKCDFAGANLKRAMWRLDT